jgi:hypothetical protein
VFLIPTPLDPQTAVQYLYDTERTSERVGRVQESRERILSLENDEFRSLMDEGRWRLTGLYCDRTTLFILSRISLGSGKEVEIDILRNTNTSQERQRPKTIPDQLPNPLSSLPPLLLNPLQRNFKFLVSDEYVPVNAEEVGEVRLDGFEISVRGESRGEGVEEESEVWERR